MRVVQTAKPGVTQSGTLTTSSAVVTGLGSTTRLQPGQRVTGSGVSPSTLISSVDSSSQVTLTNPCTTTGASTLFFAVEPVLLADAKLQCKVDIPDDDTLIVRYITAARRYVETALKQALITQSFTLYLDSFPSAGGYYNRAIREIWPSMGGLPTGIGFYPGMVPGSTGVIDIPNPPIQSITAVQYYDYSNTFQTVDPTTYNVSLNAPSRIQPVYSKVWPISRPTIDAVLISFISGYGDTGDSVSDEALSAIHLLVAHWYRNREAVAEGGFGSIPLGVESLLGCAEHGSYA